MSGREQRRAYPDGRTDRVDGYARTNRGGTAVAEFVHFAVEDLSEKGRSSELRRMRFLG